MLNTLHKTERLDKKKVIDKMFSGGARSFSVFPLRVVYLPVEELEAPVSILVSVSKRRFKRAVAFIYLSDRLTDSMEIEERMKIALARITEKVASL